MLWKTAVLFEFEIRVKILVADSEWNLKILEMTTLRSQCLLDLYLNLTHLDFLISTTCSGLSLCVKLIL